MTAFNSNPTVDDALRSEYQICRRKLESKCEALLILSKELDQCRSERDQYKLMAEQLRDRYQMVKRQLTGETPVSVTHSDVDHQTYSDTQTKSLARLLFDTKEANKSLKFERDDLRQKLQDAEGDIKLLREQIVRTRVGTTDEGLNTRHFPAHEREDLVCQLEASREEFVQLQRDLQQVLDEKEELVTERDAYRTKYDRLNTELNYILRGDEKRIVDIDALSMENKFLQERLKQIEEEKTMAIATVTKYKSILEKKKTKGILKLGQSRSGGLVITQKQVQQIMQSRSSISATPQALADLQGLCSALLDTINDKNLALSHQRKTNKILGNRVSELEKKLKTLEVSGLWSVTGNTSNLGKLIAECEAIKTLVPRQCSQSSEISESGKDISDFGSEISSSTTNSANQSPIHGKNVIQSLSKLDLEELDLLPTKEEAVPERNANKSALVARVSDCLDSSDSIELVPGFTSDLSEPSLELNDLNSLHTEIQYGLKKQQVFNVHDGQSGKAVPSSWEKSLEHYLKTGQIDKNHIFDDDEEEDLTTVPADKDEPEIGLGSKNNWIINEDCREVIEDDDIDEEEEDYGEADEHIKALMDCVTSKLLNHAHQGKLSSSQKTCENVEAVKPYLSADGEGNKKSDDDDSHKNSDFGGKPVKSSQQEDEVDAQGSFGHSGNMGEEANTKQSLQEQPFHNEVKEATDNDCSVVDC